MRYAVLMTLAAGIVPAGAQTPAPTQADDYTRYELLAPETAQFRIVYEVSATSPGATAFFNPIRKGSQATDEAVYDRLTGKPLPLLGRDRPRRQQHQRHGPHGSLRARTARGASPGNGFMKLTRIRPSASVSTWLGTLQETSS